MIITNALMLGLVTQSSYKKLFECIQLILIKAGIN